MGWEHRPYYGLKGDNEPSPGAGLVCSTAKLLTPRKTEKRDLSNWGSVQSPAKRIPAPQNRRAPPLSGQGERSILGRGCFKCAAKLGRALGRLWLENPCAHKSAEASVFKFRGLGATGCKSNRKDAGCLAPTPLGKLRRPPLLETPSWGSLAQLHFPQKGAPSFL